MYTVVLPGALGTTTTEKPNKQLDLGQQASIGNSAAGEHTVTHSVCGLCSSLSIIIMLGIVC